MQLYNLTLQKATNINHAVHGNYSGQKQQEIAVSRGTVVEILKEGYINSDAWYAAYLWNKFESEKNDFCSVSRILE